MATISAFRVSELTADSGCAVDGAVFYNDRVEVDTINEVTSAHGVTINTVSFKDSALAATDRLLIDKQYETPPDPITSGGVLWVDDGTNSAAGDIWVTSNDGSTTAEYCILGQTPSAGSIYASTDLSAPNPNAAFSVTSITLTKGTYLISWDVLVNSSSTTVYFGRVVGNVDGVITASKNHGYMGTIGANSPVGATFIVTTTVTQTYTLQFQRNTGTGGLVIDMFTGTIGGSSYNINNPRLQAWRIA